MINLIDPTLLFSPEVKAAFPPTARKMILRPIIDYINMLYDNANASNPAYLDSSYAQAFNSSILSLQQQLEAINTKLTAIEKLLAPSDAIPDLSDSPISISATNLLNIGLLSSNQSDLSKTINKINATLRIHGLIKK